MFSLFLPLELFENLNLSHNNISPKVRVFKTHVWIHFIHGRFMKNAHWYFVCNFLRSKKHIIWNLIRAEHQIKTNITVSSIFFSFISFDCLFYTYFASIIHMLFQCLKFVRKKETKNRTHDLNVFIIFYRFFHFVYYLFVFIHWRFRFN